jgi:Purple acid Phosphatase, N-terminal domain
MKFTNLDILHLAVAAVVVCPSALPGGGGGGVTHAAVTIAPRFCHGRIKHLHLAVGQDPARSMTVSFATDWGYPDRVAHIGAVRLGTSPDHLDRFVGEHESPLTYKIDLYNNRPGKESYHAPFQHHITIDRLEPDTTYYYVPLIGARADGVDAIRNESEPHAENIVAENKIKHEDAELREGNEDDDRRRYLEDIFEENVELVQPDWDEHGRRLAPPPYDPTGIPCIDADKVRSFRTAPDDIETMYPMTFGVVGDIGQFDHSRETMEHLRDHLKGIQAVVLVGDIAYPEMDGRKWDTFFDFLDDTSPFDQVPLQIAAGNHGTRHEDDFESERSIATCPFAPVCGDDGKCTLNIARLLFLSLVVL